MDFVICSPVKYIPSVLLGVLIGISLTVFFSYEERFLTDPYRKWSPRFRFEALRPEIARTYERDVENVALEELNETEAELKDIRDFVANINNRIAAPTETKRSTPSNGVYVNTAVADDLRKKVRVLCWILTYPDNHVKRALPVKMTWGKHCNKFLIMSTAEDSVVGTIAINVTEERDYLWGKTKKALQYIHKHHLNDFDWFYKADDDTYANIENMRYFLNSYSPQDPVYFGYKFKVIVRQGYMSGGAGYVMSKTALIRFVEEAIPDKDKCSAFKDTGAEDAEIGVCLQNVHVYAGDSRDSLGRGRFFVHSPEDHLRQNAIDPDYWYWRNQFYESDEGLDCCSDTAISWHYIDPRRMYFLEFFLFSLRVYGMVVSPQRPPKKVNFTDVAFALQQEMPIKSSK